MSTEKRIVVRTTEDFHAILKDEAESQKRSLNSQILEILETYFDVHRLRYRVAELERQDKPTDA